MENPVLSILALCYNHERYVDQAMFSIDAIEYRPLEVWIADDNSDDDSKAILKKWQKSRPKWNFVFQEANIGNCKTFNGLLSKCKGEFIIDFATDDVLIAENISDWIDSLRLKPLAGFCYADAKVLNDKTGHQYLFSGQLKRTKMPEGVILDLLLGQPFICPPAVLFRKSALEKVGGYDEQLAFEDLDIWLRLAKDFEVAYFNQVVVTYRKHQDSLSASLFKNRNQKILSSTLLILGRISHWDAFKNGSLSYFTFVKYHLKIAGALQLKVEALSFFNILNDHNKVDNYDRFWIWISQFRIPFYKLFIFYQRKFR